MNASRILYRDGDQLVVAMPEHGVAPAVLARPLEALVLKNTEGLARVRVDAPAAWQWSTPDAAFLAGVVQRVEQDGARVPVEGLAPELMKLLELTRAAPRTSGAHDDPRGAWVRRIGLFAIGGARHAKAFLDLVGEVVRFTPRFAAGNAKVRRAELIEVLADSSSRTLAIVAIVNVLVGAILAFVGAVQLKTFGAGIYVANLVRIASVRELTPIITAIVLAGRTGPVKHRELVNGTLIVSQELSCRVLPEMSLVVRDVSRTSTRRHVQGIGALALQRRLASIMSVESAAEFYLATYGPDPVRRGQRAAALAGKILKGASPAELPIELPTHFNVVINLKTAKMLGITIPPVVMVQATRVIQ